MKNWLWCALIALSVPSIAAAQTEVGNYDIELQSPGGASTLIIGADTYSNANFNGWNVSVTGGGYFNLQVTASCTSGSCLTSPLNVFLTAQQFETSATIVSPMPPPFPLETNFTVTQTAGETSSALSWMDNSNLPFGGSLNTKTSGAHQLATIIVNTPFGSGSVINGSVASCCSGQPYSLTLEESFTDSTGSAASFNASANIDFASAPEIDPASAMGALTLLAGGLAVLRGRRGKKHSSKATA
jgi:hypothetical protein